MELGGILAALLGLIVLAGWHLGMRSMVEMLPGNRSMHYATALCFLLCGVGALFYARKWSCFVVAACGISVACIGWILVAGYVTGGNWAWEFFSHWLPSPGQSTRPPSAPSVVGFALCGSAIFILSLDLPERLRRLGIWIFGTLTLVLSVMVIVGYLSGLAEIYLWGSSIGMAPHTAIGFALLSVALLSSQWLDPGRVLDDPWLPLPIFIGIAGAVLLLWQGILTDLRHLLEKETRLVALDLSTDSLIRIAAPFRAMDRMKRRWEARQGGTPRAEFEADALAYIEQEPIFDVLEWVDSSGHVSWVMPPSRAAAIQGINVLDDNRWDAVSALKTAQAERKMVLSPTIELKQGGKGLLSFFPLFEGDKFAGFLVAVVRLSGFLEDTINEPEFQDYQISVFDDKELLFKNNVGSIAKSPSVTAESAFNFHGHRLRFEVTPKTAGAQFNQLPAILLGLGLLLAALAGVSMRAFQLTAWKSRDIRAKNERLRDEISVRETAERLFRESEERLQLVLDSATGVSVIRSDTTGLIDFFSRGSEKILGYSAAEIVGSEMPSIFHDPRELKQRSDELGREFGREVKGFEIFIAVPLLKGSERREWTYICKDGSRRTVDLIVTVLRNTAGGIIGYLGTAVDITARKQVERQLRDTLSAMETAQELLEEAGRIARLGQWELPLDGSGPKWSSVTYEIHEVPVGTPISRDQAMMFYHPEDRAHIERQIREGIETGNTFELDARLITAKGREIWVHGRGGPILDEKGKVVALRGVLQDIDERRKAAELLEKRNEQLEIATERAEAHARAKAEFLANMSHEIRTPLNAIIGMSELLGDARLEPREHEFVETIRTSGDVLLTLINDILDFSKIESGRLDLEQIPMSLRDCVESSLDMVASAAAKKGLDLVYWIDDDVPDAIYGDPTRLRQVLVNLTNNAIKFTNKGEVFVELSMHEGTPIPRLRITVHDTGIGIPSERMDRLFQAFSQVDTSTTRRYGGTGLGLAISQRIVDGMSGRIWVESEVNKGSRFHVEIPVRSAEFTESREMHAVGSLEGLPILIVDDNETNRRILRMQVESWGMVPSVVENAAQALELIKRDQPFALAILDMMMPGVDGRELATEIRKLRSPDELAVLVLTSVGFRLEGLENLSISAVLTKPVKRNSLFNALLEALSTGPVSAGLSVSITKPRDGASHSLRILVAEDNPINQRVISLMLERLGYCSDLVSNGIEALAAIEATDYDLVFLDVQMPELDGLETAREICRRHPSEDRPYLVALTAHAVEGDRECCLSAGMDDYMSKPIKIETLRAMLVRAQGSRVS